MKILVQKYHRYRDKYLKNDEMNVMVSYIVQEVVNLRHCFHCIETVELKISTIEGLSEVTIAWEVFLLNLEFSWSAAAIVHVVCTVNSRSDVESMLRVFSVSIGHMELSLFLVARILRMRIHAFLLESLADDLAFDQLLSSFKISECTYDFRVSGHYVFFEIDFFRSDIILNPRRAVLLVSGIVETALGSLGEGGFSRHVLFYNLKYYQNLFFCCIKSYHLIMRNNCFNLIFWEGIL